MSGSLVVLMLAPFAFSTGAYVFAGLIEPMAAELGVSVAAAAQLQTAFAVACAVGGPLLAVATQSLGRKGLLTGVLVALAALNAASALAEAYAPLMVARAAVGLAGALTVPVASTIAISLVGPERRSRALAMVLAGTALSFLIGIPLGSVVGGAVGWRASFWLAATLCAMVALLVAAVVPAAGPAPPPPAGALRHVLRWPLTGLLGVTALAFTATFATAAFVGPLTTRLTGAPPAWVGAAQAMVGVGALIGLALGARLASGTRRPLPWLFGLIMAAQALYAAGMLGGATGITGAAVVGTATLTGAMALFAISPIVQTRLAVGAGPFATVAFSLNASMIFLGQGLGAALGGVVATVNGLQWVGLAGAAVAVVGATLAILDLRPTAFDAPRAGDPRGVHPLPQETP